MTIPNLLTCARLAAVPVFGALWLSGRPVAAFWVFAAAAAADLADGFLARVLRQQSRLGALLDPAADKIMLLVGYVAAALTGAAPVWLAVLVIGRDVLLSAGAGVVALVRRGVARDWEPSRLGKYTAFFQASGLGLALIERAWSPGLGPLTRSTMVIAAVLSLVTAVQYGWVGARALAARGQP